MKISKLTFSSWVFLPFFVLNLWTSVANAQSACTAASDAATLTTAAGAVDGFFAQCKSTPDAMKLKFYKMTLCKDKPTYLDDSSCVYILNETTAIDAEISVGGESNLIPGEISIPEGTYPYALLLIDTKIGIKKTLEFNVGNEQKDSDGNTGKYCWTNGETVKWGYAVGENTPITCGSSPSPQYSYETFVGLGGDVPCVVNKQLNEQTPTTSYDIYLLHDLTTPANVDESNCMPVKPANKVANYIWGVQTFNVPPSITANTTQVDMGFKLTDGINVSLKGTPGSACDRNTGNECVESANIMSFAFTMSTK